MGIFMMKGILIGLLTFLFAFSWFGIQGQTKLADGVGLVCGVFIGTYIWWGTLSGIVTLLKKKVDKNHLAVMNRIFGVILILFGTVVMLSACGGKADKNTETAPRETPDNRLAEDTKAVQETEDDKKEGDTPMQEMVIEVGGQKFSVTLYDNETVDALKERLPMTLNMEELNGNEKFYYLDEGLPTNAENVGSIRTGDIMLFGSDCLVLFFEDFNTSYSYTRIGHVEDAGSFTNALKSGTVEVTFETGE